MGSMWATNVVAALVAAVVAAIVALSAMLVIFFALLVLSASFIPDTMIWLGLALGLALFATTFVVAFRAMREKLSTSPGFKTERPTGCLLAIAIGVITIVIEVGAFTLLTDNVLNLREEWYVYLIQMVIVAAPFVVLALADIKFKLPWLVGLALTLSFWGYVLYDGVSYQWYPDGSGANIGLGLLGLASPLLISVVCIAVYLAERKWRS